MMGGRRRAVHHNRRFVVAVVSKNENDARAPVLYPTVQVQYLVPVILLYHFGCRQSLANQSKACTRRKLLLATFIARYSIVRQISLFAEKQPATALTNDSTNSLYDYHLSRKSTLLLHYSRPSGDLRMVKRT